MKLPPVAELLAGNRFLLDEEESHITMNQDLARKSGTASRLVAICPAGVYSLTQDGTLDVEYAACMECGSCLAVATPGAMTWVYPRGGFGIQYRDG